MMLIYCSALFHDSLDRKVDYLSPLDSTLELHSTFSAFSYGSARLTTKKRKRQI